jgi:hypothetical protein
MLSLKLDGRANHSPPPFCASKSACLPLRAISNPSPPSPLGEWPRPRSSFKVGSNNSVVSGLHRTPPAFLRSPRLQNWTTSDSSALVMVQGSLIHRLMMRDFCVDVIDALHLARVPRLWILESIKPGVDTSASKFSTTDLLKNLTCQTVTLNTNLHTHKIIAPFIASPSIHKLHHFTCQHGVVRGKYRSDCEATSG